MALSVDLRSPPCSKFVLLRRSVKCTFGNEPCHFKGEPGGVFLFVTTGIKHFFKTETAEDFRKESLKPAVIPSFV